MERLLGTAESVAGSAPHGRPARRALRLWPGWGRACNDGACASEGWGTRSRSPGGEAGNRNGPGGTSLGLWACSATSRSGVPLMMQPRSESNIPLHRGVIDYASLYLCRQGPRWVVVIESPRVSGAVPFDHSGRDVYDVQFDLLTSARRACPDAAIMGTDGALTSADYEWRVEVRGIEARPGDLGLALRRELAAEPANEGSSTPQTLGRRCHWGLSTSFSGRPRSF